MAVKVPMVKHFNALRPAGPDAEAALEKIPHGREVMVEIKQPRNLKNLKRWWVLCDLIAQNTDRYDKDDVSNLLKVDAGHAKRIIHSDGSILYVPYSINFASMDETDFGMLFDRVIDTCCQKIIPGMEPGALRMEIEEICGLHPQAA